MKQLQERFKNYNGEVLTNYLTKIKELQGFEQVKEYLMTVKLDEEATTVQNIDEMLIGYLENEVIRKKEYAKNLEQSVKYLNKANKDLSVQVKEELNNLKKLINSYSDAIEVFDEEAEEVMTQHLKALDKKVLNKKEQAELLALFRSTYKRNTCDLTKKSGLSNWLSYFQEIFHHHYEKVQGSEWCDLYIVAVEE